MKAFDALQKLNIDQCGEKLDESCMKLIGETDKYWVVEYCEGVHSNICVNILYKDGITEGQTIEI